jgi:hypothetical protein
MPGRPKRPRSSSGKRAGASRGTKRESVARTGSATGLTFDDLRALAQEFEGIEEGTSYGTPALKIRGQLLVRLREDGETVVLRTTFVDRDLLIQANSDVYHVTDHYRNYPYVLVRLPRVGRSEFRDRLEEAYGRFATTAARPRQVKHGK